MRNLDIATLRSLQAVAEYGAVTRAAEALNMTQSALSMQIKRLDELFGEAMLQKQGRGVVLTDFAEELLNEARKLVSLNDAILSRFTGQRPEARLRVGLTSDWLFTKVAQAVRAFRQANPRVELVINDGRSKDLRQQMKRGEHDVILTTEFETPPGAIHLAKVDLALVRRDRRHGLDAAPAAARQFAALRLLPRGADGAGPGGHRMGPGRGRWRQRHLARQRGRRPGHHHPAPRHRTGWVGTC